MNAHRIVFAAAIVVAAALVLCASSASAESNYMSNGGRHAPVSTMGGPKLNLFRG